MMVQKALEGANAQGAETKVIHLADFVIEECDGCHACWRDRPCRKMDDLQSIYAEIESTDAFVFGTPVYRFGPTAFFRP